MLDEQNEHESVVRRTAGALGYTLLKSTTPTNPQNKGGYMLLQGQYLVLGDRFGASLEEIEAFLEVEGAKRLASDPTSGTGGVS